ncbi:MAG: hypothetical protein M3063_02470 [Actinomycetota bacterium]|nr:hypothetical protein [Actinomycetota bacterium]
MHVWAEVVITILAIGVGGAALVFTLGFRRVRRSLRLVPGRPTPAPLSWLAHPSRPAQLHRRLRRACRMVIAAVGTPTRSLHPARRQQPSSPLTRVGAEVVDRAVALDARLVAADHMTGPYRRIVLQDLRAQVRSIEDAAQRLGRLDSVWRQSRQPAALSEPSLEMRLEAMEQAMAELRVDRPPS